MTGPATLLGALGGVPERCDRERGPVNGFLGCEDAVEALLNSAAAAVSSQVPICYFYKILSLILSFKDTIVIKEFSSSPLQRHHFHVLSSSPLGPVSGSFSEFEQQPWRLQQRQWR